MSAIICAVRGGPDSQATISRAIDLAVETGIKLYFLYVVNLDFLTHTTSTRVQVISEQMRQMGEFILLNAQASAERHGIVAEGIVRHGNVGGEIVSLCHELSADYLVLGSPRLEREESHFSEQMLHEFIQRIEQQTGAKVIISTGDEQ